MTSWSQDTPRVVLEMVDNHSDEVTEQQYINICNMLKYVNNRSNLSPVLNYLNKRMQDLKTENERLLNHYQNLKKPRLTNAMKNQAHWNLLKKHNGIKNKPYVELTVNLNNEYITLDIKTAPYCGGEKLVEPNNNKIDPNHIDIIANKLKKRLGDTAIKFEYIKVKATEFRKIKENFLTTYFEPHNREVEELCNLNETLFGNS